MPEYESWFDAELFDTDTQTFVSRIREAPEGILIGTDGYRAAILSNRPTENYFEFTVPIGMNFLNMSLEEIRQFMRRRAQEAGIEGLEI